MERHLLLLLLFVYLNDGNIQNKKQIKIKNYCTTLK